MGRRRRTTEEVSYDVSVQSKVCCVCNERKPFEDFYNSKTQPDGKGYRCKSCDAEARKAYHKKHPEYVKAKRREAMLKRVYGITVGDYEAMLLDQDFRCKICGKHLLENKVHESTDFLSVDHDHKTGKLRGLLCNQCNRAIGMLGDDPIMLRKAAEYLESYS